MAKVHYIIGYYDPPIKRKTPKHIYGRWLTYRAYQRLHAAKAWIERHTSPGWTLETGASGLRVRVAQIVLLAGTPVREIKYEMDADKFLDWTPEC